MDAASLERYCDEWFRAWTGTDAKRLASFYAEECEYLDPAKPEGVRGRAALERYFAKLLARNPALVWTRERLWPVEGGFIVSYVATIPVGAATITERGMDLVLLRDGLIERNEVYFDRSRWMDALRQAPR